MVANITNTNSITVFQIFACVFVYHNTVNKTYILQYKNSIPSTFMRSTMHSLFLQSGDLLDHSVLSSPEYQ